MPLYPFGHGLSYTKFAVGNLNVSRTEATVDVTNTGAFAGDEVVQLYLQQRSGRASRPVREPKGFERVSLKPGEKTTVHLTLGTDALRYWSAARKTWLLDAAEFDVWVGTDSAASLHGIFMTE